MKTLATLLLTITVTLGALLCAGFAAPQSAAGDTRFVAYDVFVDAGATPLAAWQVELSDPTSRATIVGVEGGEHAEFKAPPHYDPRALSQGRIVLAAFSTADALPTGQTRVARVHVQVRGPEPVDWQATLVTAGGFDGQPVDASLELIHSR